MDPKLKKIQNHNFVTRLPTIIKSGPYIIKLSPDLLQTMYGDLILADSQYGGNNGRRWKVDWNKAPQPVQIKLRCLRGLYTSRFLVLNV